MAAMQPAVNPAMSPLLSSPENSAAWGVGSNRRQGGRFHSSSPRQLPSPPSFPNSAKQLAVALGTVDPLSPTQPCSLWAKPLYNAPSHSSPSSM